jgi:signal transduction histidine kinase
MQGLVDRSLAEVRIAAGLPVEHRLFSVAGFIAEIRLSASLEAQVRECAFTISAVDPALAIDGDRDLLLAAVGNLLQNAFKFTRPHTESRRMPTQPATASSSTSRTTAAAFQGATPKACSCRSVSGTR